MAEIDTLNRFMVGARGDNITIMRFSPLLSKEEALNLAAYLVCLADNSPTHEEFHKVLSAIKNA